jgi:hypothetical protein
MAKAHPIPPFPADIDREHFGHYVSGFTDGEGCFGLNLHTYNYSPAVRPCAAYTITLRADDLSILHLIQSHFQCGGIYSGSTNKRNGNRSFAYRVNNIERLVSVIVPHFESHPLHAKKRRDFPIWKQGVLFIYAVMTGHRLKSSRAGPGPQRWTRERLDHFNSIRAALRQQREYQSPAIAPPPTEVSTNGPSLFGPP